MADRAAGIESLESRLQFIVEAARVGSLDWNILTGEVRWSENMETAADGITINQEARRRRSTPRPSAFWATRRWR